MNNNKKNKTKSLDLTDENSISNYFDVNKNGNCGYQNGRYFPQDTTQQELNELKRKVRNLQNTNSTLFGLSLLGIGGAIANPAFDGCGPIHHYMG